jgi:hypothetical protein
MASPGGAHVDPGEVADTDQDDPLGNRAVGVLRACIFTVRMHALYETGLDLIRKDDSRHSRRLRVQLKPTTMQMSMV